MTSVLIAAPPLHTLADLLAHLGGIDPARVRFMPLPGTATEQDALDIQAHEDRLYELVEHVLVEKAMGFRESYLALALSTALRLFIRPRNLGLLTGADGFMRLAPGLVRIPDIAYVSWERLPERRVPTDPMPDLAPDLAVEVLSDSNTLGEMQRKRREYFEAGVRLVWLIDPNTRTVAIYTAIDSATTLGEADTLDGGEVLPGFTLPLRELFAELDLEADAIS